LKDFVVKAPLPARLPGDQVNCWSGIQGSGTTLARLLGARSKKDAHGTAISRPPCVSDTLSLHSSPLDGGSVLALGGGSVSFAQIVKACEPVFAAVIALVIPPVEVKPALAYMMLLVIVGGVGLACVKEGKGVEINM